MPHMHLQTKATSGCNASIATQWNSVKWPKVHKGDDFAIFIAKSIDFVSKIHLTSLKEFHTYYAYKR